jgi:hypothetical protein
VVAGVSDRMPRDKVLRTLERGCAASDVKACGWLGGYYLLLEHDREKAQPVLKKACSLGATPACQWLGK